jgi:hypothetical protein
VTHDTTTAPSTGAIRQAVAGWNRFWFTPADPTILGLIRICCGLITLYVHLAYCYDLQEFFGKNAWLSLQVADEYRHESPWMAPATNWEDLNSSLVLPDDPGERQRLVQYAQRWGLDPRAAVAQGNSYWSIWFHVTDTRAMWLIHGGILAIMLCFTIGLATRVTSVLTWLAALSYIHRSPITVFGMDTMMNIALIYLMIGPSGAALSVDRLIERYRMARRNQSVGPVFTLADKPTPFVSANLVLRLMQVHFCFIYMAAGLSKLLGPTWWNGTALWGTLANYEFTPIRFALYAEPLRWLCRHRWLWEIVMSAGAVYTLVLEISFPFLVWQRRFRWLMVIGSVLLHTMIALTMGLIGFGLFMFTLVLSFVPSEAVHNVIDRLALPRRHLAEAGSMPKAA